VLRDEHSLTKELYDKMKKIHGAFLKDCCEEDESEWTKEILKTFHAIQEILMKSNPEETTKGESTSSSSNQKHKGNDEELLEKWYEEKITKAMKDQDVSTYEGTPEKGTCSDIEVQLTKKILITIPVKSKDPRDVDEATKRVVTYNKDVLQYEVHQVAHVATGKKEISARKETTLNETTDEKKGKRPTEEWKEKGYRLGTIGNMCEAQKNKELEALDKKRVGLSVKAVDLSKRPCAATPELQVILLENNSQLWDRIEVFERYAEQERALRIQAVSLLRRHEEKMFGKIKEGH
jgi:hypothetical protein